MRINIFFKTKFILMLFFVSMSLFIGCEDVITYDLEEAEPQLVIDASIVDNQNSGVVKLSWTSDYFNPGNFEKVKNAIVEISDSEENVYNLTEETSGLYTNNDLKISYNQNYEIKITANDVTYSAATTLAEPIIIDSLSYAFKSLFGEKYCDVYIHFQDPPERKDYAIIYIKLNGEDFEVPLLYEDRLTNGKYFEGSLIQLTEEDFIGGSNEVEFIIRTVDENTYEYYETLISVLATNGDGSLFSPSAPENPRSNFDKNVLGYFAGYSVSKKTIEIKYN